MSSNSSDKRFNLSAWALENQQMVSFFMLVAVVLGILSFQRLPRNEDPVFTIKTAVVSARWPGATVGETTQLLTDKIEKKLQELPHLDYLQSYTRTGESVVFVNLKDDTPPEQVDHIWYLIRKKMDDLSPYLPSGTLGPFVNDEFADTYGTIYAFTADAFSSKELRSQVDDIRSALMRVPNVSKIEVLGAEEQQVVLAISSKKLAGFGFNLQQVIQSIQAQNTVTPAGIIRTGDEQIAVKVSGAYQSIDSLRHVMLRINDRFIPLQDIATIYSQTEQPPAAQFRVNGKAAIGLAISMSPEGNMLQFGQKLQTAMDSIESNLPYGIEVIKIADQPAVVKKAVSGFVHVLVEAIVIVLAVSFISLGTRAGLVVAVSIPIVLAMTFTGMTLAGIGLQRISLGALIISLGLLVDDAMITIEAMVAKLEAGWPRRQAAAWAYQNTAFPMLTGTLVTMAGFIPVGFAASSAGEYCYSLFMVVVISLACSWIVAVLFSPLLGVWLLPKSLQGHHETGKLSSFYQRLLVSVLQHRWQTIGLSTVLLLIAGVLSTQLHSEFFPSSDRPELLVSLRLPANTAQAQTLEEVKKFERQLIDNPNVDHFSSYVGSGAVRFYLPMDILLSQENIAQLVVVAKNIRQREALRQQLQAMMQRDFSQWVTRVSPLELGPPVGWPLRYRVSGPQLEQVRQYAQQLANVVATHPSTRDINLTSGEPQRLLRVVVDQTAARAVGLSRQQISEQLATLFSGQTISSLREGIHPISIVVKGGVSEQRDIEAIENLQISLGKDLVVPLRQLAKVEYAITDPIVWRRQLEPFITVQTDIAAGVTTAQVSAELLSKIKQFRQQLPFGYDVTEEGAVVESTKGNISIYEVLPVTLIVMLTLLMIQLRRFSRMLLALVMAPFGLIGIVVEMLPTATPLGFVAMLGIIALVGMIIRNAVILIAEVDINLEKGEDISGAIMKAATHRARPILLTALAAILGMLPIARQVFWGPMAYAIIGGLMAATMITLTMLPAALSLVLHWESRPRSETGLSA
ncbi:efflux RND transporter permease subunit [Shewanella fodinae]|uniref:efflux RND transporter permease subunit n=1 Tax=Shewanella fodinae TaxID=552357 RepID=UPI0016784D67|nr:efflux RND transporter permease subunit [Shewanella fodinae]MCL2907525.1 efflux RND transporter permease subunit [Shewanella fodinae]GGZ08860.1 ACR family transporter [Shewanella fodinae]